MILQRLRDGSPDPGGRGYRPGFVIAVADGKGGIEPWGDQFFADMDSANITAARCVGGACDILPAREIIYFGGKPGNPRYRKTILIERPAA